MTELPPPTDADKSIHEMGRIVAISGTLMGDCEDLYHALRESQAAFFEGKSQVGYMAWHRAVRIIRGMEKDVEGR